MRDRVFGACGQYDAATDIATFDLAELLLRLLLFEEVIVDSVKLSEIPHLVRQLGASKTEALITNCPVRFRCSATALGEAGRTDLRVLRREKGSLPLLSYAFYRFTEDDVDGYIKGCLLQMRPRLNIPIKNAQRVKRAFLGKLIKRDDDDGLQALRAFYEDIRQNPLAVRRGISLALGSRAISAGDFRFRIHSIDSDDFSVETDLGERLRVSPAECHDIVQKGLFATANFHLRLEKMHRYSAVSGFDEDELPIFDERLELLARQLDPTAHARRLYRVTSLGGFPDFRDSVARADIDVDAFTKLRESLECREFRSWLRTVDALSDEQVADRFRPIAEKAKAAARGVPGKVLRIAAQIGVSLIPGVGTVLGTAVGTADTFLTEKLLPLTGPYAVLSRLFGSVLEKRP